MVAAMGKTKKKKKKNKFIGFDEDNEKWEDNETMDDDWVTNECITMAGYKYLLWRRKQRGGCGTGWGCAGGTCLRSLLLFVLNEVQGLSVRFLLLWICWVCVLCVSVFVWFTKVAINKIFFYLRRAIFSIFFLLEKSFRISFCWLVVCEMNGWHYNRNF